MLHALPDTAAATPIVPPADAPPAPSHDPETRRALEAYSAWLFFERRFVAHELYPHLGSAADDFVLAGNAGYGWHHRPRPEPSTRAATLLDAVGVDWRGYDGPSTPGPADTGARPTLPGNWPHPDHELISLEAEDEILHLGYAGLNAKDEDDPRLAEIGNRMDEVRDRVAELPAATAEGLRAKAAVLRRACTRAPDGESLSRLATDPERIGWSLADDLARMPPEAVELAPAPVFADARQDDDQVRTMVDRIARAVVEMLPETPARAMAVLDLAKALRFGTAPAAPNPDPILALVETCRSGWDAYGDALTAIADMTDEDAARQAREEACGTWLASWLAVMAARPTTIAGAAAQAAFMSEMERELGDMDAPSRCLAALAEGLTRLAAETATSPAAARPCAEGDAALIDAAREAVALRKWVGTDYKTSEGLTDAEADDELARHLDRVDEHLDKVIATPARTLAGLRGKAHAVADELAHFGPGAHGDGDQGDRTAQVVASLVRDVTALTAGPTGADEAAFLAGGAELAQAA